MTGADAAALERKDFYSGETPLITQIQLGERENVQRLLQAGADANAATTEGESALTIAFKEGRDDIAELLAEANIKVCDTQGKTALHFAIERGNVDLVTRLLELGADVQATDKDGYTALMLACRNQHEAAAAELMEATKRAGALDLQVGHEAWVLRACVV